MFSLHAPPDIKPQHKYFILLIAETIKLAINGINTEANGVTYSPRVFSLWNVRYSIYRDELNLFHEHWNYHNHPFSIILPSIRFPLFNGDLLQFGRKSDINVL